MLLINKFRGKYITDGSSPRVDRIIQEEVNNLLATETMTEANLIKLDKRL